MPERIYKLLVVDDSEDDRLLLRRSLQRIPLFDVVTMLNDGQQAIDYFNGLGSYSDRSQFPLPDVLLLDLKMPNRSGFDVLEWLREHGFSSVRIIILSNTFQAGDVEKSIAMGASHWLEKADPTDNAKSIAGFIAGSD